ncbi:MAG TPA: efflux RND transporter periplasmic adaptor subunit, partial [Armatimonadota bacterium]|nr:efflux RND transporter periplasmic adaptor subunit [Armatimonadota bacterium]
MTFSVFGQRQGVRAPDPVATGQRPSRTPSRQRLASLLLFWLLTVSLIAPSVTAPAAASGSRGTSSRPYDVTIDSAPPPIGRGQIVVHVRDHQSGQPVSGGTVIAKASMPSMPMGETFHKAVPAPGHPGEFQLPWSFQMAGDWVIQAEYKGPKGVTAAHVHVSPGALAFPLWADVLIGLIGVGLVASVGALARTRNGRERLKAAVQKKNLVALLVLAGVIVGAWLLVRRLKAGQIDWNQMSMEMADYTAPTPVSVQPVKYGAISGVITYTGTVAPYVEDTVFSRVTGRITRTLYSGDPVTAGEVVAQLDQPDLVAKAQEAQYATISAQHDVLEAKDKLRQAQDAVDSARAAVEASAGGVQEARQNETGAGGSISMAESDLQAAIDAQSIARSGADAAQAAVQQSTAQLQSARADAAYWKQEIPREAALLAHGAVSQDEYEAELAKSQAAQAAVGAAQAELAHAKDGVATAEAGLREAAAKIKSAQAQVVQARALQGSQGAKVSEARAANQGSGANLANAIHGAALTAHEIEHAYAMLDQARAAQAAAEANLSYLTITAPQSGVVTQRLADPGTVVNPGMGILKIAQLDRVRLQANVSADDLDKLHVGTPVTANVQGISSPINARVTTIFPAASTAARTAVVEAAIPNRGRRLTPGEFVTLQFHTAPARSSLLVPLSAVVNLAVANGAGSSGETSAANGGSGVWLAQHGAAHLAPVTVGASDGVDQEVLKGLKEGDLVIVSGIEGLTEGAPIVYPGMPQLTPASAAGASSQPSGATSGPGLSQKAGAMTISLNFDPSPPKAGAETLRFTLTDAHGAPVKGATIEVTTAMPSMSMGGPSGVARDDGDGTYSLPIMMGMGADWRVTVSITPPGAAGGKTPSKAI